MNRAQTHPTRLFLRVMLALATLLMCTVVHAQALIDAPTDGAAAMRETLAAAKQELAELEQQYGEQSLPAARQQVRVGQMFLQAGEPDRARMILRRAIPRMQRHLGLFHEDLVEPLAFLGLSEQALGRHRDAADTLSRAQHLTHRHQGMLNQEQVPLIYAKADSMRVMGELWEVEQLYANAIKLQRRNSGEDSPETVEAINTLGVWLAARGMYRPALTLYRTALKRLEATSEGSVPGKVDLMTGKAVAFVYSPAIQSRSLDMLRDAKELVDENPAAFSASRRLAVTLNLADMLMMFSREREALKVYREAWTLAAKEPALGEATQQRLAMRQLVRGPFKVLDPSQLNDQTWFKVGFSLRADGRPERIRVLDSNTNMAHRQAAQAYFGKTRFRPLFDGDTPLPRRDQVIWVAFQEPEIPLT